MKSHWNTSSYILISKRYFSRYVLTYEVLPLYLCYLVDGRNFFNGEMLNRLLSQKMISDKDVVLELRQQDSSSYISFLDLLDVGFTSQDGLDTFLERSYENYDVRKLHCSVLSTPVTLIEPAPEITPPVPVEKLDFSNRMAFADAIVGLIHDQLVNNKESNLVLENYPEHFENILNALLIVKDVTPVERNIAATFFKLCTQFNINIGWNPKNVVDAFEQQANKSIAESTEFTRWLLTARKLLNGEDVHVPFTDNGNITLRAMTLVLLNPEVQNLEAIKQALKEEIGINVYQLALKFAKARTGYSYLNAELRSEIGDARSFLQQLNARIHNLVDMQPETALTQTESLAPREIQDFSSDQNSDEKNILRYPWLTKEADNEQGVIISINGVKPMSGFNLNLVYQTNQKLSLRVIDADGPKGMSKFKGQLALSMLMIQKDLPVLSRFEVRDKGLYLTLPLSWIETRDLKDKLNALFLALRPLGIEQKSSMISSN